MKIRTTRPTRSLSIPPLATRRARALGHGDRRSGPTSSPGVLAGPSVARFPLPEIDRLSVQQRGGSALRGGSAPGPGLTARSGMAARRAPQVQPAVWNGSLMRAPETKSGAKKASPDKATRSRETSGGASRKAGLCIRTPLGPGQIRFTGSKKVLQDFAVMPEDAESATDYRHPTSGTTYGADGFWWKQNASAWFKVPDHCTTEVNASGGGFSTGSCCNWAASLIKGRPRWSTDGHTVKNPFAKK